MTKKIKMSKTISGTGQGYLSLGFLSALNGEVETMAACLSDDSNFNSMKLNSEVKDLSHLAASLKILRGLLDSAAELKTRVQKIHDELAINIIPERMDEDGIETMKVKDVGRLQVKSDIRCYVPATHKLAVRLWLIEHGHSSMVTEVVNAATLKAFVKEQMKQGTEDDYPAHLLTIQPYSKAVVVNS